MLKQAWDGIGEKLGVRGRMGFVLGAIVVVMATVFGGYVLLRPDYQVLFADLSPQDASAMSAELEKQKVPYRVDGHSENRSTILVESVDVHKTRMKLMGKDMPLHGAVGFELFNNGDFGMTEFAQKITYQRALQGELTRTILSLAEIRDAKVLLALPEQGLFRQATSKPKASVTLALKQGQKLRQEQVSGVQRLVAAAVPGIAPQDVTIVDQSGVALTRSAGESDVDAGSSGRLDVKKETESYLARKASDVLDKALGAGQAWASVDVTLNMDRVQTSLDEPVSVPTATGGLAGVMSRERATNREVVPTTASRTATEPVGTSSGSSQREVEYVVGRRVEQVISYPGSVRRIQVAVVVRQRMSADQQEHLRKVIAATVGASFDRGDSVVVQPLDGLAARAVTSPAVLKASLGNDEEVVDESRKQLAVVSRPPGGRTSSENAELSATVVKVLVIVILGLVVAGGWWMARRRSVLQAGARTAAPELDAAARAAVLAQVRAWVGTEAAVPDRSVAAPSTVTPFAVAGRTR